MGIGKTALSILQKSKGAFAVAFVATGIVMMISAIGDVLPDFASPIYTFIAGLLIVLLGGWLFKK